MERWSVTDKKPHLVLRPASPKSRPEPRPKVETAPKAPPPGARPKAAAPYAVTASRGATQRNKRAASKYKEALERSRLSGTVMLSRIGQVLQGAISPAQALALAFTLTPAHNAARKLRELKARRESDETHGYLLADAYSDGSDFSAGPSGMHDLSGFLFSPCIAS